MRVACDASGGMSVKRESSAGKVPMVSCGDRVWRGRGLKGWMDQLEFCPQGDAEENPAAVEGLLLLQHSGDLGRGRTEGSGGRSGRGCHQVSNQEPAGSCGTDSSSPRQRTASLSKLYQNMEENPELRDPVARARVKLGKGWEGEDGDRMKTRGVCDSIFRVEEWIDESWVKAPEDIICHIVHGVPGTLDAAPVGMGRGESFYRGVYTHKNMPLPYSVIKYLTKQYFLGYFRNALEAAKAWDLAALKRAMTSRTPLSKTKLNYSLQEYLDNQSLVTVLVQYTFLELVAKLRSVSNVGRSECDTQIKELLEGRDIPENDDQEGNVQRQSRSPNCMENNRVHVPSNEMSEGCRQKINVALVSKSVKHLRTLCSGSRSAQNTWIKQLRDDHKFKGVYFSRDGVPYSKVELEGKYHYLGRFDTIEEAARAYDLATLKRAMLHTQSSVSLNFPPGDYTQDIELMHFIQTSSCGEVAQFIRNLAQNRRGMKGDDAVYHDSQRFMFRNFRSGMILKGPRWSSQHNGPPGALCSECQYVSDVNSISEGKKSDFEKLSHIILSLSSAPASGRGICGDKVYKRVSEKNGWVQVGVNTFAAEITGQCCNNSDAIKRIPDAMAMWFTGLLERHGSQEIQISDAEFNRSFDLTISTENDGVRFTSGWGKFVKEANLQSGEILIFMKTDCPQKLRYTVAMSYKDTQAFTATDSVGHQQIILSPPAFPNIASVNNSTAVAHVNKNDCANTLQKTLGSYGQSVARSTVQNKLSSTDYTSDPSSSTGVQSASACLCRQGHGTQQEGGLTYPNDDISHGDTKWPPPALQPSPVNLYPSIAGKSNATTNSTNGNQDMDQMVISKVPVTAYNGSSGVPKRPYGKMYLVSDINGQVRLVDEEGEIVNTSGTIVVNREGHAVLSPKTDSTFYQQRMALSGETEERGELHASKDPTFHTKKKLKLSNQEENIRSVQTIEPCHENAQSNQSGSECRKAQKSMACGASTVLDVGRINKNISTLGAPKNGGDMDWSSEVFGILKSCKGLDSRIIRKFAHKINQEQKGTSILELAALSKAGKHDEIVKRVEESMISM